MTGGTAILESLTKVTNQLSIDDGRNIVVLITDGYDEDSDIPFDQALDKIKSAKSTVYVIGIAGVAGISIKGEDLLRKLAQETGGRPAKLFRFRRAVLAERAIAGTKLPISGS